MKHVEFHVITTRGRIALISDDFEKAHRFQRDNPHWSIVEVTTIKRDVTFRATRRLKAA